MVRGSTQQFASVDCVCRGQSVAPLAKRVCPRLPVGAGNSAVDVDLPRWGPMLSPRVPNLVPIAGITGSARCAVRTLEGPRDHRVLRHQLAVLRRQVDRPERTATLPTMRGASSSPTMD